MSDILILGGGSAGCVLASRLSENPGTSVTLVEAGADVREDAIPDDVASGYPGRAFLNGKYLWTDLTATMGGLLGNAEHKRVPRRYEQARVLGGGSSINAMVANRGAPSDYDEWARLGAEGWSWDEVLPYFRKLERDRDFDGAYHGKDGPLPICRRFADRQSGFVRVVCDALVAKGHVARQDQNGPWEDGVFPVTVACSEAGRRVPVPLAYLPASVRARPNLRILTDAQVRRLVLEGACVVGAEVSIRGRVETLRAARTIVSCGALHTPALLMRSGIGPAAELTRHGIEVIAARAGVGRNLMEHPSMAIAVYLRPQARLRALDSHHIHACLRFSSNRDSCPPGDMHMAIVARSGWHGLGSKLGNLFVWVNKAFSRGEVTLNSADPAAEPNVDFRLLSDARDRERLALGVRLAADVLSTPSVCAVAGPAFPAAFSDRVRRVSVPTLFNAFQTAILGHALDWSFGLRGRLIQNVITRGVTLQSLLDDDRTMDTFLDTAVGGTWHASGTCRMGRSDDPMAVTDPEGRVYGVDGLRICDASLMPSIPCANTNVPTIMMAERLADRMKASW